MTNKEAIEILKNMGKIGPYEQYEAICMAISALDKQEQKKPLTNADKHFHNATDEQLAEYLSELSTAPFCTGKCHKDYEIYGELRTFCRDCWLDWLKQEVKDNA